MLPALAAKHALRYLAKHPAARRVVVAGAVLTTLGTPVAVGAAAVMAFSGAAAPTAAAPASIPGIPPQALAAYTAAVAKVTDYVPACQGLSWADLAAIAQVESSQMAGHTFAADGTVSPPIFGPELDGTNGNRLLRDTGHDPLDGDSPYMRAAGPFQILPSTWTSLRQQMHLPLGNPQNINDAALTAAVYLCGNGRDLSDQTQLSAAILEYNNSRQYVEQVESWISTFTAQGQDPQAGSKGQIVIAAAERYLGTPYSYAGGSPSGPTLGHCDASVGGGYLNGVCYANTTVGFDCSGLALYAYAQVGIDLPRNSQQQYDQAPTKFTRAQGLSVLQPGDLVFFAYDPSDPDSFDGNVHHVGIYLGGGMMIDAATTGTKVREEAIWLDQYSGGAQWW
jgi:cell wall-associated NlpC family hydrolase